MPRLFSLGLTALSLLSPALGYLKCTETLPTVDVHTLYSFGNGTWAENLAIRANGDILVSRLDVPEVLLLDPLGVRDPITIASWDADTYMGCLGISETTTDVFYVITSSFNNESFVRTSGVNSIWEINLSAFSFIGPLHKIVTKPTVKKLVDVTTSDFLNGLTTLSDTAILAGDAYNGWVYYIDTTTGAYHIAVNDEKMKFDSIPNPPTNLGVNGIKVHNGYLYWSNTAVGTLNRIQISESGVPSGESEVVVDNVPKADDFIFRSDNTIFMAQNQMDELSVFFPDWSDAEVLAGSNISTTLAGVSAAKFGRLPVNEHILYLTTSGAEGKPINGSVTVPGTLSWIDTQLI
ncbi:hypothetical protein N7495_006564 [Penicillium taxi]|uniref:uncharacterized protein n=1 Tax=Penicillium taxi TaxID=168475 RepID=UPI002545381D|nr:uncharacterized protein N7495_006564 [Penicillium taxi]KAJ5894873.1 hypothetical protein N7495_006564 [Penicillium taxi]